ncbi:MAG: 4-alpha-glucanotransferase [Xanthobacteraceae bacterium]|nr:4-alpha-glucanotransferase [Xanthobacteraceae bacterium]
MTSNDRLQPIVQRDDRKLLDEAQRLGIETRYIDAGGREREVDLGTVRRVVDALSNTQPNAPSSSLPVPGPTAAFAGRFERVWGLAAQLYGVRSARNWGHGDFTDLDQLLEIAAARGAAAVGVNPLHTLFDDQPDRPSPYSPNSRLFLNPLYIDVERIPFFPGLRAARLHDSVAALREHELIDYAGVTAAKLTALKIAHAAFRRSADASQRDAFASFCRSRAPELSRFAAFECLRRQQRNPWWEWPAQWRVPDDVALAQLRRHHDQEIEFHEFVQWIAHVQLDACAQRARRLGLPIGLYLDIAVGVDPAGFDAWNDQAAILREFAIGAPPDLFNPDGQNWGLAGFNAVGLSAAEFAPFRAMLRASMRYAGAIRLDHVLGLKRLYVIPAGFTAEQGAYLRLPFEHLLELVAEESLAQSCVVIGEDLGTVPEGLRETLAKWGIWRYHVLIFERGPDGSFVAPSAYARDALVTNSTHDLPTFVGWCRGADLQLRQQLGLEAGETEAERARARSALGNALAQQGLAPLRFRSVVEFMSATPARFLMLSAEDILGLTDQPNVPGTTVEHPNWRRRLPIDLADFARLDELAQIAELLKLRGRGSIGA